MLEENSLEFVNSHAVVNNSADDVA